MPDCSRDRSTQEDSSATPCNGTTPRESRIVTLADLGGRHSASPVDPRLIRKRRHNGYRRAGTMPAAARIPPLDDSQIAAMIAWARHDRKATRAGRRSAAGSLHAGAGRRRSQLLAGASNPAIAQAEPAHSSPRPGPANQPRRVSARSQPQRGERRPHAPVSRRPRRLISVTSARARAARIARHAIGIGQRAPHARDRDAGAEMRADRTRSARTMSPASVDHAQMRRYRDRRRMPETASEPRRGAPLGIAGNAPVSGSASRAALREKSRIAKQHLSGMPNGLGVSAADFLRPNQAREQSTASAMCSRNRVTRVETRRPR